MSRILLTSILLIAIPFACAKGNDENAPAKKKKAVPGVCADDCPKACASAGDCDADLGEVCCGFGSSGKVCLDEAKCPTFCTDDSRCATDEGQACFRTTLESTAAICTSPKNSLRLCPDGAG